ncbi:MAG TPA: LON peptidase substrate-binding domain-containing protein [Patescibacteria group bacterium]|nr:LON peptidase substrate-binding domain-containing protein [Patescibacteria group bacterium]
MKSVADMPGELPVFPLAGVLLLPRGYLPLNIFEPRYLNMVEDALKSDRLIGMIQPRAADDGRGPLFDTGCAGKITDFTETADGRFEITLTGICRFRVGAEVEAGKPYRRVKPDWSRFGNDFTPGDCLDIDRAALKKMLGDYFKMHGLSCDWDAIDGAPDGRLITCLSMICPFDPGEKQALLEADCCRDRARKFMSLLEMAVQAQTCKSGCH